MKYVRRAVRRALGVGFILLMLLPPLFVELRSNESLPPTAPLPTVADSAHRYRVFVADWGYHTSIILEQPAGWRLGPPGHESSPFVEYAWGDRRYYMESDHRPHALFAALLLPTESVTYVDAWPGTPRQGMRTLVVRDVSARELTRLAEELERWRVGEPYPVAKGYPGRFYPAPGAYLWWTDCNRWTADRLARAGMARGGRGVLFSGQVSGRLQGFRSARD